MNAIGQTTSEEFTTCNYIDNAWKH